MVIDLELPSEYHQKDGEDSRSRLSRIEKDHGCKTLAGDGPTTNSLWPDEYDEESEQTSGGCASNSKHRVHAEGVTDVNPHRDLEPHNGMEFDSKEDAFTFYKKYAKSVGFATITKASRRSRISRKFIDAKFVCTRYGKKRESVPTENPESVLDANGMANIPVKRKRGRINESLSKTDCQACMHVKGRQDGRWFINSFIKEHNHEIFPEEAYYLCGQGNIEFGSNRGVTSLHAIRARTKKIYVSMSGKSGTTKKVENEKSENMNASGQTLALEVGDAQIMLQHFLNMQVENPNFFSAIDLNPGQQLRNAFWVNAKERLDYEHFSDVVFFDTTYLKNEYKLPFAPFIGVNHHAQFMLLGCVLIADQSKSNFVWGMQAWLRAMGGRAPKVILTDQDKVLKEAVSEVFPNSRHCFCLWHILTKIQEKLGYVTLRHDFIAKFNKCVLKSWEEDRFEKRWWKMVDRFGLRNDSWIKSLYEDCKLWVPAYMTDIFLAGISTPQRSDSINTFFDEIIQRKTTLTEFLDQYKTCLREKSEDEAKADFETWHKQPSLRSPSPFGKQMALIYTHAIFKKFQVEVLGVVACHPKKESDDGLIKTYKVQDFEEKRDFIMIWNERTFSICCSCHLFEYNGFLCRHVMIVLQMCGVHNIPSQYILKRWTKDAKSRQSAGHLEVVESSNQRYNNLCQRALKLGEEGSLSEESYNIAFKALEETLRKCERVNFSIQSMLEPCSPPLRTLHDLEMNQDNCTSKKTKEACGSKKGKVLLESEAIGMPAGWQQLAHSAFRAPIFDCSYESQEPVQVTEQLTTRVPSLDGFFGTQLVHGMGQLNSTPLHDAQLLSQQRLLGLGQFNFRPQMMQGCFDMQHNLQDMDHSDARPVVLHAMESKQSQSKHLPL